MSPRPDSEAFMLGELVRRAFTTTYGMISREVLANFEAATTLEALVEVLVAKGVVAPAELAAARAAASEKLATLRAMTWTGPNLATFDEAAEPRLVDCETRRPHCATSCCTFYRVMLTDDEVRDGRLLWELSAPYELPRAADGRCLNLDAATGSCTVWAHRPEVCRRYTCADDGEIWSDFEAMVPTERVVARSRITQARSQRGGRHE